jgi:hypothetical protein
VARIARVLGLVAVSLGASVEGASGRGAREAAPLPDVATLFQEIEANQKRLEAARDAYAYTKTETDLETDGQGRIKEKAVRIYEVFSVDGRPVEKLVARDGLSLSPDEARREDERVGKVAREHRRKAAAGGKERRGGPRKTDDDDDDVTVSDLLRVCRFVNPRREPFRGQEALAYDFEPRPGAAARGRVESWLRRLRGSVWIDEDARRILRLEARVSDVLKVAGGLFLSVRPGSSIVFEQKRVEGEVWLPSYAEVNLSARFLLLKRYRIHQTQRFSDYKRFEVETSTEIQSPPP